MARDFLSQMFLLFDFQTILTKAVSTINMTAQIITAARQLLGMKKKYGVKTVIASKTSAAR